MRQVFLPNGMELTDYLIRRDIRRRQLEGDFNERELVSEFHSYTDLSLAEPERWSIAKRAVADHLLETSAKRLVAMN
jgi:hypothetical protein